MITLSSHDRRLRRPEERVGTLPNADLPPPCARAAADEHLLQRALRHGDEAAFQEVFHRYYPAMIRLAEATVRTRAEAEEVVHDAWLRAIRGIGRFQGRATLKTWLFRILRNRARTVAARSARTIPFSTLGSGSAGTAEPLGAAQPLWALGSRPDDPARQLLRKELRHHLAAALRQLPARQQEVVTLRDVEGWSAEEVCNVLGISQSNQRVLLHRGRRQLRSALEAYADQARDQHGD